MMSKIAPDEIVGFIKASNLSGHTMNAMLEYLEGICDAYYAISIHGAAAWSKGIDPYSQGMNSVASFFSGNEIKHAGKSSIDADAAISVFETIRYVTHNFIKENGMRSIDELAAVGIAHLGKNPYENRN